MGRAVFGGLPKKKHTKAAKSNLLYLAQGWSSRRYHVLYFSEYTIVMPCARVFLTCLKSLGWTVKARVTKFELGVNLARVRVPLCYRSGASLTLADPARSKDDLRVACPSHDESPHKVLLPLRAAVEQAPYFVQHRSLTTSHHGTDLAKTSRSIAFFSSS